MTTKNKARYQWDDAPFPHLMLVFPSEWVGTKLPNRFRHSHFDKDKGYPEDSFKETMEVTLIHPEDPTKVYKGRMFAAYDNPYFWGDENLTGPVATLGEYFYLQHFCTCHRKIMVNAAGGDEDEECEGTHYIVQSITAPDYLPGVVLYSETMKELDGKEIEV